MASSWLDNSEIVVGLILEKRLSPISVRPEMFHPPYNDVIKLYKAGICSEEIIQKTGLLPIQTAHDAARNINGLGELNWVQILEQSASFYSAGDKLEKMSKKLMRGDDIDWSNLTAIARDAQSGMSGDFVSLSEVEGSDMPFIPTGWKPLDDHLTGIPETGLIIVAGQPGVGKTTFLTKLVSKFAQTHTDKVVAVYTIEMMMKEIAMRFRGVEPSGKEVEKRILLNEKPVIPEEVISKASTIDNLGLVAVDFADLMVRGESGESSYGHIYRTLALGAKSLGCPIVLLSQLSRYERGLPKPKHIRYTGMAEALAWMILMLYDPARDWYNEDDDEDLQLPVVDNTAYVLCWKIRGGFRSHLDDSPGAIQMAFKGKHGWGNTNSRWYSLKKS